MPSVIEQIHQTRSKLEKRFSEFEKSLSYQIRLPAFEEIDSSPMAPPVTEKKKSREISEKNSAAIQTKADPELELKLQNQNQQIAELQRETGEFHAEKKALEETIERLSENLKIIAEERKDLMLQIQSMDEQIKRSHSAQQHEAAHAESNLMLQQKLNHFSAKRRHSAQFWKGLVKLYKEQRKLLRTLHLQSEDYENQVTKLMNELDSANELIAELRDELRAYDPFDPAHKNEKAD